MNILVSSICLKYSERNILEQDLNKQTNERTNEQTNERTNKQTDERTNKQTNKKTNERTKKQTNEQTNKQTKIIYFQTPMEEYLHFHRPAEKKPILFISV